jgi:hypothetical protein
MTKSAQGWYWLAAGVLALGLNGVYHDGGANCAREAVNRFLNRSEMYAELIPGRAQQVSQEMIGKLRLARAGNHASSCRLATATARQTRLANVVLARTQAKFDRMQAMADQRTAALDRVEAQVARLDFEPAMVEATSVRGICPRARVAVPSIQVNVPAIRVPEITVPAVHINTLGMNVSDDSDDDSGRDPI